MMDMDVGRRTCQTLDMPGMPTDPKGLQRSICITTNIEISRGNPQDSAQGHTQSSYYV